jgi:hypothetical protein
VAQLGHLERMEEHRLTKKITEWKSIAFRPRRRQKISWEVDVKHDLKVTKICHWRKQATGRTEWRRILEQAKTHRVVAPKKKKIIQTDSVLLLLY